jgi:predicted patatin/cPLA2 family phospholipase
MSQEKEYNAIVLSSGAARGYYLLGALHFLQNLKKLDNVKYYAGTSVGSAIALLLALGFSPMECCSYTCTNDINSCFKFNLNLFNLAETWGLVNHKVMKNYLEQLILTKMDRIPTFEDLYKRGKVFICTAYCITGTKHKVYFSHKTHPTMSVLDAIMLSMSIPVVFSKSEYKGDVYIDGGIFDRLPAEYTYNFILDNWEEPEMAIIDLDKMNSNQPKRCDTFQDYVKWIFLIPLHSQRQDNWNKTGMNYFKITCDHEATITLMMSTQEKINSFCIGSKRMSDIYYKRDTETDLEDKIKLD